MSTSWLFPGNHSRSFVCVVICHIISAKVSHLLARNHSWLIPKVRKKSAHGQRFLLVFRYIRRNLFDFFHTVEECRVGCSVPAAIACGHETGSTAEGRCARRWVDSTAIVTAWCLPAFHRSLKLQSCAYSPRQSAACHPAGLPAHTAIAAWHGGLMAGRPHQLILVTCRPQSSSSLAVS